MAGHQPSKVPFLVVFFTGTWLHNYSEDIYQTDLVENGSLVRVCIRGWFVCCIDPYKLNVGALGWSIFTLLTPIAARTHFILLIAVRVLLGASEGKKDIGRLLFLYLCL